MLCFEGLLLGGEDVVEGVRKVGNELFSFGKMDVWLRWGMCLVHTYIQVLGTFSPLRLKRARHNCYTPSAFRTRWPSYPDPTRPAEHMKNDPHQGTWKGPTHMKLRHQRGDASPIPQQRQRPLKRLHDLDICPHIHQQTRHKFKHSHRISQCIRLASNPSSLPCVYAIRVRNRFLARSSSCALIVLAHAPNISPHPRHSSHMPSSSALNASMRLANCVSSSAQSYSSRRTEGSISRSLAWGVRGVVRVGLCSNW